MLFPDGLVVSERRMAVVLCHSLDGLGQYNISTSELPVGGAVSKDVSGGRCHYSLALVAR